MPESSCTLISLPEISVIVAFIGELPNCTLTLLPTLIVADSTGFSGAASFLAVLGLEDFTDLNLAESRFFSVGLSPVEPCLPL